MVGPDKCKNPDECENSDECECEDLEKDFICCGGDCCKGEDN
jgi:hypothetical protein|tara:strand:+ start:360 stop:485 length:126 start_codon:yes stop_codon:yes gene_type:complete